MAWRAFLAMFSEELPLPANDAANCGKCRTSATTGTGLERFGGGLALLEGDLDGAEGRRWGAGD